MNFPGVKVIFHSISRLASLYRHSHLANNGPASAVAYFELTAVSDNVNIALAVELIDSVEAVLAAMLTCSQSNIRSHSHYFNHPFLHPSIINQLIHPFIPPSIHPK